MSNWVPFRKTGGTNLLADLPVTGTSSFLRYQPNKILFTTVTHFHATLDALPPIVLKTLIPRKQ